MFASFGLSVLWYFVCSKTFIPERKAFFNYKCEKSGVSLDLHSLQLPERETPGQEIHVVSVEGLPVVVHQAVFPLHRLSALGGFASGSVLLQ